MRKPDETIYTTRGLYLRRWWLRKRGARRVRVYLHNAVDSDDDRALHDHIGHNISIVLWGGYIEHVFAYPPVNDQPLPPTVAKRRYPGMVIFRRADKAHRLELNRRWQSPAMNSAAVNPCWSLFIAWPKSREWGFWCERQGIVGETVHPLSTEAGAVNYILQYPGKVAEWVHNMGFLSKGGCA